MCFQSLWVEVDMQGVMTMIIIVITDVNPLSAREVRKLFMPMAAAAVAKMVVMVLKEQRVVVKLRMVALDLEVLEVLMLQMPIDLLVCHRFLEVAKMLRVVMLPMVLMENMSEEVDQAVGVDHYLLRGMEDMVRMAMSVSRIKPCI